MPRFQTTYPDYPVGSGRVLRFGDPRAVGIAQGSGQTTTAPAGESYVEPDVEVAYHAARAADAAEDTRKLTGVQLGVSIGAALLSLVLGYGVVYYGVKHGTKAARR